MVFDTVIRGGTLVTPGGPIVADLGIRGEKIACIGQELAGRRLIDAAGLLVLPGAIDPHVHLAMPAGQTRSSDDWETGTIAAVCGGTTTVIDFVEPGPNPPAPFPMREGGKTEGKVLLSPRRGGAGGEVTPDSPLLSALVARRAEAEGQAVIDYGLHMTLRNAEDATLADIPAVVAAGCPSFKTYLTYEGLKLSDEAFLAALEAVSSAGGLALVHAENDAGTTYLQRKLLAAGQVAPRYHPRSRPAGLEAEAIQRALALADLADCPLYVVHVSSARGAAALAQARDRGQRAIGETCPQYLLLTETEYQRPGFEGAKFVCSPPLRTEADNKALWRHLVVGDLSTVGTDHCPFYFEGQKELGRDAFTDIPGGMPGIEARLTLMYSYGVGRGILSLERWVAVCCTLPARFFGLYPRKGALVPGADADIVLFDPLREVTVSHGMLHENCDYTPYEGIRLQGYPTMTLLRGQVLCQDGAYVGPRGEGRFLSRSPFSRR